MEEGKKLTKKEKKELEKLGREIEAKKQLPQEELNNINAKIFENIISAIIIMIYLYFMNLGSINIAREVFSVDLQVFSICILIVAIILFEQSYKKENGNLAIHGIEVLIVAIVTLFSMYIYILYSNYFNLGIALISLVFAIYFVTKSIYIYIKMKKDYLKKTASDVSEITKKEKKKK